MAGYQQQQAYPGAYQAQGGAQTTNQERINEATMTIENPNVVGSGFIRHPPQKKFEGGIVQQPLTCAVGYERSIAPSSGGYNPSGGPVGATHTVNYHHSQSHAHSGGGRHGGVNERALYNGSVPSASLYYGGGGSQGHRPQQPIQPPMQYGANNSHSHNNASRGAAMNHPQHPQYPVGSSSGYANVPRSHPAAHGGQGGQRGTVPHQHPQQRYAPQHQHPQQRYAPQHQHPQQRYAPQHQRPQQAVPVAAPAPVAQKVAAPAPAGDKAPAKLSKSQAKRRRKKLRESA